MSKRPTPMIADSMKPVEGGFEYVAKLARHNYEVPVPGDRILLSGTVKTIKEIKLIKGSGVFKIDLKYKILTD